MKLITANPSFTTPTDITANTDLTFKLTVTDDKNGASNDDIKITVEDVPPVPSLPDQPSVVANQTGGTITNETSTTTQAPTNEYQFVRKWGSEGSEDGQFAGTTRDGGVASISIAGLVGIAVDSPGNIYVADTGNSRIQKFDSNGNFITEWGSGCHFRGGTVMSCSTESPGAVERGDGQFEGISGVAADSSGNVYIADFMNNRIQKFDSEGNFITKWGTPGTGDGQFYQPTGITVDSLGNVFVTEFRNDRIQKFDSEGNFITKWGSEGSGDGQFDTPLGVAVDSTDSVYVADFNNRRIQKFDSEGNFITKWGSQETTNGHLFAPTGLAVDSLDNVYVVHDNDVVQKFDNDGNFITEWGSSGLSFYNTKLMLPRHAIQKPEVLKSLEMANSTDQKV